MEVVNAIGRRKAAVARVYVSEGTGKITINNRDLANYFPSSILQFVVNRDPRSVERKKPGRPKARKRFQFSKR